jgi:uncharacterized protein (DUF1499 family)
MKIKRILLVIVVLLALLVASGVIAGMIWPRINDVQTGETPEYPRLQPQHFKVPVYQVFDAARAAAGDLGWQQIEEDRPNGKIFAVDTTRLFCFKDDITISIQSDGAGGTIVNVRSHSRIGKGDFGTNARRIERFQAELARRL